MTDGHLGLRLVTRSGVPRAMLLASGVMLALAATALVGGWLVVLTSDADKHGPGSPGSPIQIGRPAPDFELFALDESHHSLSDYRGGAVALNFWAMWCLPCRLEIGALNEAQQQGSRSGLTVVSVDVRERPSSVIAYAEDHGMEYLVLLDPYGQVSDLYGVTAMPTTIWIDAAGIVRRIDAGVQTAQRVQTALSELTRPATQAP